MMRDGCQEAIYKIRAQSKRTVYVRLRQKESLTLFLSDMNKSGHTATSLSEEAHKEKVSGVVRIFMVVLHDCTSRGQENTLLVSCCSCSLAGGW